MKRPLTALVAAQLVLLAASTSMAREPAVVLDQAVLLTPEDDATLPPDVRFLGQPANGGVLDLTATNGFFDRCFEAVEPGPAIEGDEQFIRGAFGCLVRGRDTAPGSARWHLWVRTPGEVSATFFLTTPPEDAGHSWVLRVGDETQVLTSSQSDGESAQGQTLTFRVDEPGLVTVAIDCSKMLPPAGSRLHYIRLEGPSVATASLLRARWRPAAVHARFFAPEGCESPRMWVFETRCVNAVSSYSPMTTGFGYYGTSFDERGKVAPGAGFNFSMWAARRGATAAPPLHLMPRLIGTGLPDATYSTFGHEGTGVKFRDAVAYPDGADRLIQALRVEPTEGGLLTYYGYFYDERADAWRLYASAQAPAKADKNLGAGTVPSTGSFCEVPGPPNRERSGDLVREIKRRGWFYGRDNQWRLAVLENPAKQKPSRRTAAAEAATNKRVAYADDYATQGWITMSTGGVTLYVAGDGDRRAPDSAVSVEKPGYLRPEKVEQLFALPVEFGESRATQVADGRATIEYDLTKTEPHSRAVLYYGPVDCVTYPPKNLTKGSAVEIEMHQPERTWSFRTPEQAVAEGANRFQLAGLSADTTYYYRLFVTHDQGKSWDYRSGRLKAK